MTTRREFMSLAAAAGGALGLGLAGQAQAASTPVARAARPLRLLFLGGTGFIGPHQVEYALARGHEVTLFNRGRIAGLFGGRAEELTGDRDANVGDGLAALAGERSWDAVIDNSGYVPRHVRDSCELLRDRVGRYLFISTVSVYDFDKGPRFPEDGPLAAAPEPPTEEVTGETYGALKAECDRIVREVMGDAATVVRPAFIVGPGDTTDRFTYWVHRVHAGGEVAVPDVPWLPLQWVDVRDLAPWVVGLVERDLAGVYNAAGPASTVTWPGMLWGLRATTSEAVDFHWASPEVIEAAGVNFPMLYVTPPESSPLFVNSASLEAGLVYRPLADTAMATLEWWRAQPEERRGKPRGWPSADQERALITRIGAG